MMILILEDDADRIARFRAALATIEPAPPLRIWRNGRTMVREVGPILASARLISLDHDLEPTDDDPGDPGDGMEVARYLAGLAPTCPVVIHSSNGTRSDWMLGEFELGGWEHHRVALLGDDWIEAYWRVVVACLLDPDRVGRRGSRSSGRARPRRD